MAYWSRILTSQWRVQNCALNSEHVRARHGETLRSRYTGFLRRWATVVSSSQPDVLLLPRTTNVFAHNDSPKTVSDSVNAHHLHLILHSLVTNKHNDTLAHCHSHNPLLFQVSFPQKLTVVPFLHPRPAVAASLPAAETSSRQATINGPVTCQVAFIALCFSRPLIGVIAGSDNPIRPIADVTWHRSRGKTQRRKWDASGMSLQIRHTGNRLLLIVVFIQFARWPNILASCYSLGVSTLPLWDCCSMN